jgi:hypothetical protein
MRRAIIAASALTAAALLGNHDAGRDGRQGVLRASTGESVVIAAAASADVGASKKLVVFDSTETAKAYTLSNKRSEWFQGAGGVLTQDWGRRGAGGGGGGMGGT